MNYNIEQQKKIAENFCKFTDNRYICHEYYYHSNGNYNWLHVVVDDYGFKTEIKIDLNAAHNKRFTEDIEVDKD